MIPSPQHHIRQVSITAGLFGDCTTRTSDTAEIVLRKLTRSLGLGL